MRWRDFTKTEIQVSYNAAFVSIFSILFVLKLYHIMHLEKEHLCNQYNCYFPLPMPLYRNYFCQCNVVYTVLNKVLTYIEYRAVSGVFRTIDPSPPSECVLLPPHQRPGGAHSPGGEGVGGQYFGRCQTLDWWIGFLQAGGGHIRWVERGWRVNISEDARHWIGLLQYNPSTLYSISPKP